MEFKKLEFPLDPTKRKWKEVQLLIKNGSFVRIKTLEELSWLKGKIPDNEYEHIYNMTWLIWVKNLGNEIYITEVQQNGTIIRAVRTPKEEWFFFPFEYISFISEPLVEEEQLKMADEYNKKQMELQQKSFVRKALKKLKIFS